MNNRNSALVWFNAIKNHLPVPKTIMVEYDHHEFMGFIEDNQPLGASIETKIAEIEKACQEMGYPCFIRTDLASGKHSGPICYKATDAKTLTRAIWATVEDNEMKFWPMTSPSAFMIREFLDLNYDFKAFNDLPIAREFRFFADEKEVKCVHPYWPESAIKFYGKTEPGGWELLLKKHHNTPENIEELKAMAIKAAGLLGGTWSVDFAEDKQGKWWLIDMAEAESSYHWEDCENKF